MVYVVYSGSTSFEENYILNKMTNSSTEIKEEQINEKVRPEEAK
jgi:hypothetical protein